MEAARDESPRRWPRVAAGALGVTLVVSALAVASWPTLLEGPAQERVVSALERKFDVVEVGCFELDRTKLRMCDVRLEKGDAVVEVDELIVDFQVLWLEQQVRVDLVRARGGKLVGELSSFRELRSSIDDPEAPSSSSGRLQLEDVLLEASELALELRHHGLELSGMLAASSGTGGLVDVELLGLEAKLDERGARAAASTVTFSLQLDQVFPLELKLEDAEVRLEDVAVKSVAGRVVLEDDELQVFAVDLGGQTDEGQGWTLEGDVDRVQETVDVLLGAEGIRPSQLPGAHLLPLNPEEGTFTGELSLKGSRRKVEVGAHAVLEDVLLEHPRIAPRPVALSYRVQAEGELDLEARELLLKRASISPLADASFEFTASGRALLVEDPRRREYELHLKLERAPCQRVLEAVPDGLAPALGGFVLEGDTGVDLELVVKMHDPDATVLEGGLDLDACKIVEVPEAVAALRGPFSHVVRMKTGRTVSRILTRGATFFFPYDRIPASVPGAVVSTEDGGFWSHDGFLKSQFRSSLRRNVELGRFKRGASTITMQMTKNVLLTHERTLSRKLQEMFLTWVLERQLSKERIMELYLNVVELGPGIYGIGDAADQYFGKTPLELTSLEAAFIATLLPRPIERHQMWCRGELTPKHDRYVRRVHRRMLKKGRIAPEEFDRGEAKGIIFSRRGWSGEKACIAAGQRVMAGKHTQGALSGLLLGRPD